MDKPVEDVKKKPARIKADRGQLSRRRQNLLMVILVVLGVAILIYPDIAHWYHSNQLVALQQEYNEMVAIMAAEEIEHELNRARIFNDNLTGIHVQDPFVPGSGSVRSREYYEILNFDGIMGRIEIPMIEVNLPIAHGTSDRVLARGAGHMENTPFPIGGIGNHAIITAHTGMLNMRLFTYLYRLDYGDLFFVEVLGERIAYEVDFIITVYPHEIEVLVSYDDRDLITLVTCTPYGVNSHRLLVRGSRIPYEPGMAEEIVSVIEPLNIRVIIIISFGILFLLIILFYRIKQQRTQKRAQLKKRLQVVHN